VEIEMSVAIYEHGIGDLLRNSGVEEGWHRRDFPS
jgi:hypothetical protein